MKIADFETLKKLTKNGLIKYRIKDDLYHKAIIDSDIPFKPGVYLFYAVKGEREIKLLYIGKAGQTGSLLNAHPLPVRLLASEPFPSWHKNYNPNKKMFLTRSKLIPEKVRHFKYEGLNIYPEFNSNAIEKALKNTYKNHNNGQLPCWMKR